MNTMTNKLNSVAYCGLCCDDCFARKGEIADLARDLRKVLRQSKFKRYADFMSQYSFFEKFKDYDTCYEVLGQMVKYRCSKNCSDGGGPPFCKIRKCCQKKDIAGCWQCDSFETCEKLKFLEPTHEEAHIKNCRKLKKIGIDAFLNGKRNW